MDNTNVSLFLAKKYIVENIYNGVNMEGYNVTFPQTEAILNKAFVSNIEMDAVQVVLNLRDAWKFLFDTYNETVDINYICKINSFVANNISLNWGTVRNGEIRVSGTEFVPKVPNEEDITSDLERINDLFYAEDRATDYLATAIKSQWFWDGNKRTSILMANKYLIQDDVGIFQVNKKDFEIFSNNLNDYYNDKISKKDFMEKLKYHIVYSDKFKDLEKEVDKDINNKSR